MDVFTAMNVMLLVIYDGRADYLDKCLASVEENLQYPFRNKIIVNDSGDAKTKIVDGWSCLFHPQRRGFVAAINSGWNIARQSTTDYIFHLEQDFTFNKPVNIPAMIKVLEANPHLAHLVLRRQPWNADEIAAGTMGGFEDSTVCTDGKNTWTKHEHWYSTNPALVPRSTFERTFPAGSEVAFGAELVADGQKFAFWGSPDDPPRVTHIGVNRAEEWKL